MKVRARQFNLYLTLAALTLLCGCQTGKQEKLVGALRVHLEANASNLGTGQTISLPRSTPVLVTIATAPVLTEANLLAAKVINAPGGFALEMQFDQNGTWLLEQYSAANPGKHFVIFAQWGEKTVTNRWLAAPLITHRIADGILAFTPDASRAEAEQLVHDLNPVIAKFRKGSFK